MALAVQAKAEWEAFSQAQDLRRTVSVRRLQRPTLRPLRGVVDWR